MPGETWSVLKSKTRRAQLLRCCSVLGPGRRGGGGQEMLGRGFQDAERCSPREVRRGRGEGGFRHSKVLRCFSVLHSGGGLGKGGGKGGGRAVQGTRRARETRHAEPLRCCTSLQGGTWEREGVSGVQNCLSVAQSCKVGFGVGACNKRGAEFADGVQSCACGVWPFARSRCAGYWGLRQGLGFGLLQAAGVQVVGEGGIRMKVAGVDGDEGL